MRQQSRRPWLTTDLPRSRCSEEKCRIITGLPTFDLRPYLHYGETIDLRRNVQWHLSDIVANVSCDRRFPCEAEKYAQSRFGDASFRGLESFRFSSEKRGSSPYHGGRGMILGNRGDCGSWFRLFLYRWCSLWTSVSFMFIFPVRLLFLYFREPPGRRLAEGPIWEHPFTNKMTILAFRTILVRQKTSKMVAGLRDTLRGQN